MGEQRTFAGIAWSQKGKVTRRERFLAEMDAVPIEEVHSTGRRNIMEAHSSAGGMDAATTMAGAPEPGGTGRAVATLAAGRSVERDRPRARSAARGAAPGPGRDRRLHPGAPPPRSPRAVPGGTRGDLARRGERAEPAADRRATWPRAVDRVSSIPTSLGGVRGGVPSWRSWRSRIGSAASCSPCCATARCLRPTSSASRRGPSSARPSSATASSARAPGAPERGTPHDAAPGRSIPRCPRSTVST